MSVPGNPNALSVNIPATPREKYEALKGQMIVKGRFSPEADLSLRKTLGLPLQDKPEKVEKAPKKTVKKVTKPSSKKARRNAAKKVSKKSKAIKPKAKKKSKTKKSKK